MNVRELIVELQKIKDKDKLVIITDDPDIPEWHLRAGRIVEYPTFIEVVSDE